MTRERPILFSGAMTRAILAGTKTQTRRVCKWPIESNGKLSLCGGGFGGIVCVNDYLPPSAMLMHVGHGKNAYTTSNVEGWESECPYGAPGDRLWVREAFAPRYFDTGKPGYRADWDGKAADCVPEPRWKPSIHMPRAASRLTLDVTDVRVQRLQEISEGESLAEGVPRASVCGCEVCRHSMQMCPADAGEQILAFRDLWDSINGKRPGCSWDANPWVWSVSFKRVETRS